MKIGVDVFAQQGISDHQIQQLIQLSHTDPDVKKFTSDPTRFADLSCFNLWLQQGRIIYTLFDSNSNLLGIIWFGQKEPPVNSSANFTFAIRIYPPARGCGLALPFMKLAFADLLQHQSQSHITGFWLETDAANSTAIHLYRKFGFRQISRQRHRVFMVLSQNKVSL